jgi:hypothetical protein
MEFLDPISIVSTSIVETSNNYDDSGRMGQEQKKAA